MLFNEDYNLYKILSGKEKKEKTFRLRIVSSFQPTWTEIQNKYMNSKLKDIFSKN